MCINFVLLKLLNKWFCAVFLFSLVWFTCFAVVASGKETESVIQMRRAMKHGLAVESHKSLLQCWSKYERGSLNGWSEGRLCYYESLIELLDGELVSSIYTAANSFQKGIPEFGESEKLFRNEINEWHKLLFHKSFVETDHFNSSSVTQLHFVNKTNGNPIAVVKGIVHKIRGLEEAQRKAPSDILNDVRLATWELLLGEFVAIHPEITLPTTSIDSLISGRKRLAKIELRIEENPKLEDKISAEPELAIRLDTVRVRKIAFARRETSARAEEVRRLSQLRELVRTYRDLTASMVRWQTFAMIGDSEMSQEESLSSLEDLQSIYDVVDSRRELHLFDDEPVVNDDSEFSVIEIEPLPFSNNIVAALKGLQGLAYFNNLKIDPDFDERLLEHAEVWASAALIDVDGPLSVPDGADSDNVLAKWVLSLASELKATRLAINKDKTKRLQAKSFFNKSKQLLAELIAVCEDRKVKSDAKILTDARNRYSALDSPQKAISDARELVSLGQPYTARAVLLSALQRHPVPAIGIERLRVGLRTGLRPSLLLTEWNELLDSEILDEDSFNVQIVLGEIRNRSAAIFLTSDLDDDDLKLEEVQALDSTLAALSPLCDSPELSGSERAIVKSVYALAFAQKELLTSVVDDELRVGAAYRHAKDAEFKLVKEIAANANEKGDSEDAIVLRESLISSRLAAGHLAAIHLEDWQADSQIFFFAATDAAAKLQPTEPLLALLGRPLLNQIFNNTRDKATKLAAVEKHRRQMITRCLEAIFTAEFGSVEAGAEAMQEATDLAQQSLSGDESPPNLNPETLSAFADGFDAKITLPQTIQAFGVLTEVRASLNSAALGHAVQLASNGIITADEFDLEKMDFEQVAQVITQVESPLVAFVLGKSLESFADSLPIAEKTEYRQSFTKAAVQAYMRGEKLLQSERLVTRYPHYLALIKRSLHKLQNPESHIRTVTLLVEQQRFVAAAEEAKKALSSHPYDAELWRIYFTSTLAATGVHAEGGILLLQELGEAKRAELVPDYEYHLIRSEIFERRNEFEKALDEQELASAFFRTENEKIDSLAKTARLRVLVSAGVNEG